MLNLKKYENERVNPSTHLVGLPKELELRAVKKNSGDKFRKLFLFSYWDIGETIVFEFGAQNYQTRIHDD